MKWLLLVATVAACGDNVTCGTTGALCSRLSYFGFFDDVAAQVAAPNVIPFDVNTPLFSDYATKYRYLYLPPGTAATWRDLDALELPTGAVLIKTFSYLRDRRDPSLGRELVETRLPSTMLPPGAPPRTSTITTAPTRRSRSPAR